MKPRIFIYIHYLEIGGAERALLGLLHALDPGKVDIDLFLNQHTGEFLSLLPDYVNLLPQQPEYSAIERPIKQIVKEGHISIALRRLYAKYLHSKHRKRLTEKQKRVDESIFQYVFKCVTPALPSLHHLGTYDLAISFMHPHNIVRDKVNAKTKVCWIHTDYSTVYINHKIELPVWNAFDKIASISDEATKAFAAKMPEVSNKLTVIENILSPSLIRAEASKIDISDEMPRKGKTINLLSIGRYSVPKRFEYVPQICRYLLDNNIDVCWYIIGFGNDAEIKENIAKYGVSDNVVLLGKKSNPYPYIKACDIYVQPSLYEGKSVTVREAQILCKPVVISNYPTAKSQINNGVDGVIVALDIDQCAKGIADFINDAQKQQSIISYLTNNDYGNESEVNKIYKLI